MVEVEHFDPERPFCRYAIFAWAEYEARGGWRDLYGLAVSFEEAQSIAKQAEGDERDGDSIDQWEIADLDAGTLIEGAVSVTISEGDYYPPGKYWQCYDASDEEEARAALWTLLRKLTPRGTVFDPNERSKEDDV